MMHQVLWWEEEGHYDYIIPNSDEGRADTINYWTVLEPLFRSIPNQVVICAGDIGAKHDATNIMYDTYENITLICTAMGNGIDDNFIVINVDENKDISYDLICLDSEDLFCIGDLEDYYISTEQISESNYEIYPNPVKDMLFVNLESNFDNTIEIISTDGRIIYKNYQSGNQTLNIDVSSFKSGLYIVRMQSENGVNVKKIIIE
jgi:hypothetical protein